MPLLRFHWDFFGPDAQPTADHFLEHVETFCAKEGVADIRHWTTDHTVRVEATLECDQAHMLVIRDALKPKRAEKVLE